MITGCSSGIGRGIAEAALKRGGEVTVDTTLKDNYPRRLLLGTDAVDFARKQYLMRLEKIDAWENVSGMSDYKDV